jgi:hypothetical protein
LVWGASLCLTEPDTTDSLFLKHAHRDLYVLFHHAMRRRFS